MKKNKLRFIRCIWHDIVDMLMWLSIIGLFTYHLVSGEDVSKFLWVMIFYVYYFMYRKFTFWQDRRKMWEHLKESGTDVDSILQKDDY